MYDGRHSPVHAGVGPALRPYRAFRPASGRPYLLGDVGNVAALIGGTLSTAVGVPGGPIAGAAAGNFLSSLFGGSDVDKQRQARAAWTLSEANQGSPLAAAIIVAAPGNVANDEAPFWQAALSQVRQDMLNAANVKYPTGYWPKGLPDFYTDVNGTTHRAIVAEVQAAGGVSTPPVTPSSSPYLVSATPYAPTYATAGGMSSLFTNKNLLIGGALLAAVVLATRPAPRRS